MNNPVIYEYHAHVYFNKQTLTQAVALCEQARDLFGISMGRVHQKRVGPHPGWSCLLRFNPMQLAEIQPWLMSNRNGLTVFMHAVTGNDLIDHTEYVVWLGESQSLDLSGFDQ
ncbi:DOPA 4,5-dioxygenase family protein [Oceanospirillum sediminis]|uniref:DOPA 4,5-dioxygenase family protein n=1 Tax=Oceanospirillum sediminis TaxID=2760088 RepID=A0A839IPX9_9GAMM|nr:DOPA 4,5-dioxygenase family protein [Oceanospirillum sediminis]MBB1486760.1 DOPA 4,5-dioxygenase family protein [Oceanospirillum sediminis]